MRSSVIPVLLVAVLLLPWFSGCTGVPAPRPKPQPTTLPPSQPTPLPTEPAPAPPVKVPAAPEPTPAPPPSPLLSPLPPEPVQTTPPMSLGSLRAARFSDLPGWREDDHSLAWPALMRSCSVLRRQSAWRSVCAEAEHLGTPDPARARAFFERNFQPWQLIQPDSGVDGLVTGYYEPLLRGSRTPSPVYRFPLYTPPDDLIVVDLASLYPELRGLRLRGRLQGNRVVPYHTRADIEAGRAPLAGKELAWVDDPVELFFLHVQGSGRLRLENGETIRVGYAEQNGHPYRSIARWLVDHGELTPDRASMQGIKDWARRNPERLSQLLNVNPSFVFFRELPNQLGGPVGSLGVPLTDERSIAVDPRAVPLGVPVWLATTRPNSSEPLNRLMLAQDTGSAIRGNVRADFFWGFGDEAGRLAGAMRQRGRMWVLLPHDYPLQAAMPGAASVAGNAIGTLGSDTAAPPAIANR